MYAFQCPAWSKVFPEEKNTVCLNEIMRQRDSAFQTALNNLRMGYLPQSTRDLFDARVNVELKCEKLGIKPTRLYAVNHAVDAVNEAEMDILASDDRDFFEYDSVVTVTPGTKNASYIREKFVKDCNAPARIQLCVDAQVILLFNMDVPGGLVNGSRGVVTGFVEDIPKVRFTNNRELIISHKVWERKDRGRVVISLTQVPLKLAWSISIHKSQGSTLEACAISMSELFASGQGYTGVSRVKDLDCLTIIGDIDWDKVSAHPEAVAYYKALADSPDADPEGPTAPTASGRRVKRIRKVVSEVPAGPV